MWQELTEIALLGTEKRLLDPEILPGAIKEIIESSGADQESKFLEAVCLGTYFIETGKNPETFHGEIDTSAIIEDKKIAPSDLEHLFSSLIELAQPLSKVMVNLWLRTFIDNQYIVSPGLIVSLLKWGENQSAEIQKLVVKVIGKKGQGILSFNDKYSPEAESDHEKIWDEGTTNERKDTFAQLLKLDPQLALKLLTSTWDQEAIVSKKTFLSELRENPQKEFIPFLENVYSGDFLYKKGEKKTERTCRKIVAETLMTFSETSICKETCNAIVPYIRVTNKKGILGLGSGKGKIDVALPENEALPFWTGENMEKTYGFEPKDYDIALFQNLFQYWFSCFLEVLPLKNVISGDNTSVVQLTDTILSDQQFHIKEGSKTRLVFLNALLKNNLIYKDIELAEYFINNLSLEFSLTQFQNLKAENFEKLIKKKNLFSDTEVLKRGPYQQGIESWGTDFSRYILTRNFESLQQSSSYFNYNLGNEIAPFIHSDCYELLFSLRKKAQAIAIANAWEKHMHEPISKAIEIRKVLKKYKKTTK